jgi:hypothetical protein
MLPDSPEPALARWFADGPTSLTHPVLAYALRTFFVPLGIEADWLEAEVFGDLENGGGGWWLRGAKWLPRTFERSRPAAADFAVLLEHPEQFRVAVDAHGRLGLSLAGTDPAARAWLEQTDAGWPAIRQSLRAAAAAETFIYATAGAILASQPAARLYTAGKADQFCQAMADKLASTA